MTLRVAKLVSIFMKCRLLTLAGMFLFALPLSAAPATTAAPSEMNFLEVFAAGGIAMYPLTLISVILVIFVLVFFATIRRNAVVSDKFMSAAEAMIRRRPPDGDP